MYITVIYALVHALSWLVSPSCDCHVTSVIIIMHTQPEWKIADPICTFLFSVLVLISTIYILKDVLRVLMKGMIVSHVIVM